MSETFDNVIHSFECNFVFDITGKSDVELIDICRDIYYFPEKYVKSDSTDLLHRFVIKACVYQNGEMIKLTDYIGM